MQDQAETNANSAELRAPSCDDIWTEGGTLPADYTGCEQDGSVQTATIYECADGTELTTFADEYFAVLGGPVQAGAADTTEYANAFDGREAQ